MTTDTLLQDTISHAPSPYADLVPSVNDEDHVRRTLVDLLHDGFYLLLLLKNRYLPSDVEYFSSQIRRLLDNFERNARHLNVSPDDVYAAKYAFCAAVDEMILSSDMSIREVWERAPLQLILFGDQLAGENFFSELEEVRRRGQASVQTLEVFYMCLLTGFQGKYRLEGQEKLNYLIAMLDKEIAHLKGRRAAFAPHWKAPDNIKHMMKAEVPIWIIASALAFIGVITYASLDWLLASHTNAALGNYFDIVKLTPKLANITISLP